MAFVMSSLLSHINMPEKNGPRLRILDTSQRLWVNGVADGPAKDHFIRVANEMPHAHIIAVEPSISVHAYETNVCEFFAVEVDEFRRTAILWSALCNKQRCSSTVDEEMELSGFSVLKKKVKSFRDGHMKAVLVDMRSLQI